jgi:NAD(P)-dependent dehydrogenase (short-subunit alcohol dehydrogenase family)
MNGEPRGPDPAGPRLAGQVAIVTGGSLGLGYHIADSFLREGASVAVCGRHQHSVLAAADRLAAIAGDSTRVLARVTDVSRADEAQSLVSATVDRFGRLDILVNNAGILGPKGAVEEVASEAWIETVQINLFGTMLMTRAVLPFFKGQRRGRIINLSGGGATAPQAGLSAYGASKAAVVRFSETVANEVMNFGITVNAVAPGALNTRMLDELLAAGPGLVGSEAHERALKQTLSGGAPIGRAASLCVFLASPDCEGITGRLISAVWDPWESLPAHREELQTTDVYTLRRIVPRDRQRDWG